MPKQMKIVPPAGGITREMTAADIASEYVDISDVTLVRTVANPVQKKAIQRIAEKLTTLLPQNNTALTA